MGEQEGQDNTVQYTVSGQMQEKFMENTATRHASGVRTGQARQHFLVARSSVSATRRRLLLHTHTHTHRKRTALQGCACQHKVIGCLRLTGWGKCCRRCRRLACRTCRRCTAGGTAPAGMPSPSRHEQLSWAQQWQQGASNPCQQASSLMGAENIPVRSSRTESELGLTKMGSAGLGSAAHHAS